MSVTIELTFDNHILTENFLQEMGLFLEKILQENNLGSGEVNLIIGDDKMLQDLNHKYRSKNVPTDVLSFSYVEGESKTDYEETDFAFGDIFISIDRAEKQAVEVGHNLEREIAILAIHGMLHLMGYDHNEDLETEKMREKENSLISLYDQIIARGDRNE